MNRSITFLQRVSNGKAVLILFILTNMGTVLVDEAFYRKEKTISTQLFLSVEFMNSPD